ncbi:MAG: cation:proton antiporter [Deltaproteobacteria bacterium]|nr:cation:proton antiporter [Deltaproteobacteria bacterium]
MTSPLHEHEILIFIVQFALLLSTARILGDLARRFDQPAVMGELLAGILLGPSVFGNLSPAMYSWVFPVSATQSHLLELLSFLGMILLLLKSGFETDVKILKGLGRPALISSAFGMIVPFLCGLVMAYFLPDEFLVDTQRRLLFSFFLGTLMAISAIPVIAKILMDLDVLRRDIGAIILGSGVMQDIVGYTIFSFIIAVASGSREFTKLSLSLVGGVLFIVFLATLGYRLIFRLVRWVDDRSITEGAHTTLTIVVALVLASFTHVLGLHAVFGAMLAGIIVAAAPRIRTTALEHIEKITDSVFAPVFFAYVGLRVDFLSLTHWDWFAVILAVAIFSKIAGSLIGGRIGHLRFWDSVALGIGTTARGSMEMIAALIGLSVGLLNSEMYAVIVLMAMITSLIAPPLLKLVLPKIQMTEEEKTRLKADKDQQKVIFKKKHLRLLIPTAGGPNAKKAIELAIPLGYYDDTSITTLFISSVKRRWRLPFLKGRPTDAIGSHQEVASKLSAKFRVKVESKNLEVKEDYSEGVVKEIEKGYDIVFLGASGFRHVLYSESLNKVVEESSAHIAVVKAKDSKTKYRHLLVPTRGDYYSKLAVEFALLYAEAVEADVTLFHVLKTGKDLLSGDSALDPEAKEKIQDTLSFETSPYLSKPDRVKVRTRVEEGESAQLEILKELGRGDYDLLVLGAENRSLTPDLNLGYGAEFLIEKVPCSVVTLIPRAKSPKH